VQSGQTVTATLDSYPDWQIPSKVIAIIPTADRQKATVKVRVGFVQLDPRILPDMGVKVAFQGGSEGIPAGRIVTVPASAVRSDNGKSIAWAVRDGKAERRAIAVAMKTGDEVTVTGGLNSGDRVVVEGGEGLTDGARVAEAKR
jgi:RND family efflux transporter MFP subunit